MKALQEVFGGTTNRVILAAGFYKKPSSNVGPEPLVSRDIAPLILEIRKDSQKSERWIIEPWRPFKFIKYARKPWMAILMWGREVEGADLAAQVRDSPWHELVAGSEDYKLPHRFARFSQNNTIWHHGRN